MRVTGVQIEWVPASEPPSLPVTLICVVSPWEGSWGLQVPSQGLTTQIDVVGSDGVEPGTYSTCTTVTRTKN